MPKVTTSHIAITYTNDTTDTETRVITNSSLEAFARELQSYDWRSVLLLYDSTKALVAFGNGFCNLYDKYFPLKIYKKGHIRNLRNLWISEGLKKSSNTKERLYKRFSKISTGLNEKKKNTNYT